MEGHDDWPEAARLGDRPPRQKQGRSAMTETISRDAATQAGARIDSDAYARAADFLPLKGIDHVEFWVGNARQTAAYCRAPWGFAPVAFSGLGDEGSRSGQLRDGPERHPLRVHRAAHAGW